jgi:hypothetical protein
VADESPEDWLRAIERKVDAAINDVPPDFASLLKRLPSIDPLVARDALQRRTEQGSVRAAALVASAAKENGVWAPSPRPIAHPLEYDWRFAAETAANLVEHLAPVTVAGDTIGYLGAPAAFAKATHALPDRDHVLIDRSTRWPRPPSDRCRIISIDLLRDPLPTLELAAAVLDPPWYREYHETFVWAAAMLLRRGGLALVSFPPPTMRPGVAAERAGILQNAARAGLLVEHEEPLALRYATPPFERAAFAAAGVHRVPDDWRRGDMLILRKTDAGPAPRPAALNTEADWLFVEVDDIPLAVREVARESETIDALLFGPAVPGAVLPSVSRRESARAGAVLWSSRNRIYTSSAPATLRTLVGAFASDDDAARAVERVLERGLTGAEEENVLSAAKQLRELIQTERDEHGLA